MDYDSYIQELTSDSVPQDRAEQVIAEAVCAYMNELADNARDLYEQRLKQRCQDQGQVYTADSQTWEKFPLELFTKNIKANKLDAAKWNATIQDYLASHTPPGVSLPDPSKAQDILNSLSAADQNINGAFPNEKDHGNRSNHNRDKIADNNLGVVVIPVIFFVAAIVAVTVLTGAGMALGAHLRRRRGSDNIPRFPSDGGSTRGPGDTTIVNPGPGRGDNGGDLPLPSPPVVPDKIQKQRRKKERRDRKKRRQKDKDRRRKDRKDYYFGYVDRVEPAGTGYEIRVEGIAENSLSDEVFIRELEKLAVAAGNPGYGRYRLALISIYVHNVPPAVEVGKWINFKVETKNMMPATTDSPDVSGAFTDGVSLLETLEPTISFSNLRIECYFANNEGFIVQTDVKTITNDITASAFATLQAAFSTFNFVAEHIKDLLDMFMNKESEDEKTDEEPLDPKADSVQPGSIRDFALDNMLSKLKKHRKPVQVDQKDANTRQIKKALFPPRKQATKYNLYDVGQGHSGRVFSDYTELFANDFGYGRVGNRKESLCSHMIKGQGRLPILLSHWDADHFRIAKSSVAKEYSGSADDISYRTWVAPGGDHIQGPVTHELAWNIEQNRKLLQWPGDVENLKVGNVTIINCEHNSQYQMPDKNNYGSLALVIGSGDYNLIYPGDANYESIPGISDWNHKVTALIATHHGSTVALKVSRGSVGESIPIAGSDQPHALFSYAKGNTYGHDIQAASEFYAKAGYNLVDTTAAFKNQEDTFEIVHFGGDSLSDTFLFVEPENQPTTANRPVAVTGREVLPGLYATTLMPQLPSDWANTTQKQAPVALSDESAKQFPALLTLSGSGGVAPKPDQDDLLQYAIRDEYGDIVIYDIKATKIVLEKLPLCVPCNTDYPVTVQLSCRDIEIRGVEPQAGVVPLVRFDVDNGFEWDQGAEAGQDGESGNPGFAGGRIRLAVAGEWTRTGGGAFSAMSGFSIQYRGGRGSNGQKGGNGRAGRDGVSGGVMLVDPKDKSTYGDYKPTVGGNGGKGGRGGDAGAPGTIADSEVLVAISKWPAGGNVIIDTGIPGTDSEFGKIGTAGKGGVGGPGGKGSRWTYKWLNTTTKPNGSDREKFSMPDGPNGQNGDNGKEIDPSAVQFKKAKVNLKLITTEEEVLDQMAAADWRFYSDE